ncbi:Golgi-associated plant pathogenesis-related protein 1-like isoform X1 [Oculina patagonica]
MVWNKRFIRQQSSEWKGVQKSSNLFDISLKKFLTKMSSVFIVLVLVSFQVFCDGAPGRVIPARRRFPWYASREDYGVDKRTVNQNACLQAHNDKRALHAGTSGLTWDATLAQHAQDWANHLIDLGVMQHSEVAGEGENLYEAWSSSQIDASCADAVQAWYDEIKDYSFNNPGFSDATGHFTQVVWKGTTKVGVGVATSSEPNEKGAYISIAVARYSPPGNYMGQFEANVGDLL